MSPKQKRSYSSPLRQQQAAVTRERIVESAIELLTEQPAVEISHENVARAAGIAARTAYRHFPTRADLLDSVWQAIDDRLGISLLRATNSEELLAFIPELFHRLDRHAAIVDALITSSTGHEMSRRTGQRRLDAIERALADETSRMSRHERDRLVGLVRVLTSPLTWHVLRQKTRVTGEEPAHAVRWALEALLNSAVNAQ